MSMSQSTALRSHSSEVRDSRTGPAPIQLVALRRGAPPSDRVAVLESVRRRLRGAAVEDRPLLWGEVGSWACLESAMDLSEEFLDASIQAFDSLGGSEEVERAAGRAMSTQGRETDRVFLGEAHERSLLCLYRGLLYLSDGDFGNAQACFRKGALEDFEAAGEWAAGDWFVLDFLAWQALERMDPGAAANLMRSMERRYPGQLDLIDREVYEHPLIILCGLGPAPNKVLAGDASEVLGYRRGRSTLGDSIRLEVHRPESPFRASMNVLDDVFAQATARGRRAMDDVNQGKASTADARNTGGHVVTAVGAVTPVIGPLIQIFGEVLHESASEIDATADVRQLTAIPGKIALWRGDAEVFVGGSVRLQIRGADVEILAAGEVPVPEDDNGISVILGTCSY